ncbi:hypothetical protein E4L95_16850 [Paracoccus liaowanqingii]|uniref:Secreted protein n=1 Tax=Paracoccus liaowanqingii TaxID=2560053 RepID=A0A4Z1CA67_9RHOB|nr:hypothetical protein E4191_17285 [Paracoccus liaowanqingii]TGN51328.1 hypothetical protein E4L95_16850 [Paracoccus liaowanqingii]
MIELLISACALSTHIAQPPPQCRDFSLLYDPREVSIVTCMIHGQPQVAMWKETHPTWRVKRWQCRTRDLRESRA